MTRPPVILHVTAPSRVGGLEKVVTALATGHARAGLDVHVAAVAGTVDDAEAFLAPLAKHGVQTIPIVLSSRAYVRERATIESLCRTLHPSVVHTHGYRSDVIGSWAARRAGVAVVSTAHGFTFGGWRNRLYERLQLRAFRGIDAVVAVSQALLELLVREGVPRSRIELIVNAWASDRALEERSAARQRLGVPAGERSIAWLGRLSHEKGANVMVEAIPHLTSRAVVYFIGGGPERASLEARVAALGVGDRVRWLGVVDHAGSLLTAFDAFALSSRTEGTPIALFEAMAAGLPIAATRVGGVPAVLGEGSALLVDSENPIALARALDRIFEAPAEAARRADIARARLNECYAVEPWLDAYTALYRRVAAE